jgi:hypothetical protein
MGGWRAPAVTPKRVPAGAAEPGRPAVAARSSPSAASNGAVAPATDLRPAVEESAADRLAVTLVTSGQCWVSATVDGKTQVKRLLQSGDRVTFDVRRDLMLTTGDSGAVTMTINGTAAKPLGRSGEVVTIRLDLSNFRTFLPAR